ncbi:unnamed protein product [Discula destructiva]
MCSWSALQAAVIQDTVYMDGGNLYWRPRYNDSWGEAIQDQDNFGPWSLALNFNIPFNVSQNVSAKFDSISKGPVPLYYNGAMLANDDEYFLYGGSVGWNYIGADPVDNQGLKYKRYDYGIEETGFTVGYISYGLESYGNLSTRNIAYGAAANVPSENLAFVFSGLRSPNFGQLEFPAATLNSNASEVSNTLFSLDFTTQNQEKWTNYTLPESISGRASAELVWVPVGEKGILVALGGVVFPSFTSPIHQSVNATASNLESTKFMTNVDVYDIANSVWYTQATTGGPGPLTQGCAVMQPASDYSSFNIYWYGGYDGLNAMDSSYWNDAVWVLSLPSFTWTRVIQGRSGMARAGHKCVMPYPDQMMVIGGSTAQPGGSRICVNNIIQLFNVSSATWLDKYDPTVWSNYSVPNVVYEAIGGDGTGGATTTKPSTWDDAALGDVFQVKYGSTKIKTYYPYSVVTPTGSGSTPTTTAGSKASSGSGVPKYLPPLLGVILGLIFISSIVVFFVLWRRRRLLKKNGGISVVSTDEHGHRIISWIYGQSRGAMPGKTETITTTEELAHPRSPSPDVGLRYTQRPAFTSYYEQQHQNWPQEVDSTEISKAVELPASPGIAELSDVPLSPSEIVDRSFRGPYRRHASSLGYSSLQHTDQGSLVSSTSFARNAPGPPPPPSSTSHGGASSVAGSQHPVPVQPQQQEMRPDSGALPTPLARDLANKELPGLPAPSPRGESGVSAFSERERAHLRNSSDPATVSTMDAVVSAIPPRSQMSQGRRVGSPPIFEEGAIDAAKAQPLEVVSPPTNSTAEGEDYLAARGIHGIVSPVEPRADL